MKIALVQFHAKVMDIELNCRRAFHFIDQAAHQQADLIAFPELFYCGYHFDSIKKNIKQISETLDGALVQRFCRKAKEQQINLILPLIIEQDGMFYNSAILIDRSGSICGIHHKVQLWGKEKECFQQGNTLTTFEVDERKIGILICYDSGFPETARMLGLQGAELIVVPSAFELPDKYRWDIYFQARALENGAFVAALNHAGEEDGISYFGNNRMVNPDGQLLSEGAIGQEEMQIISIDLDDVKRAREKVPYLTDLSTSEFFYYK
ncbi:MAG: carbon-nitrogen hydrolase family protein [Sporolactobacillus sp.]